MCRCGKTGGRDDKRIARSLRATSRRRCESLRSRRRIAERTRTIRVAGPWIAARPGQL